MTEIQMHSNNQTRYANPNKDQRNQTNPQAKANQKQKIEAHQSNPNSYSKPFAKPKKPIRSTPTSPADLSDADRLTGNPEVEFTL